jgi:NAD-dependent deacetylase
MTDTIQRAQELLGKAKSVFVLTGAGISAESGLKTYRGNDLSWRGRPYHEIVSTDFFRINPRASWDWHLEFREMARKAEPNAAHRALADQAKRHGNITLVTQNIDGLHERAGHPEPVLFHGSVWITRCTKCEAWRHDDARIYETLPMCTACGARERPGVVWFGDTIPRILFQRALLAFQKAEVLLVVGTSALVSPASQFIHLAHEKNIPVIEVNPAEPGHKVDLYLQGKAGDILPTLFSA